MTPRLRIDPRLWSEDELPPGGVVRERPPVRTMRAAKGDPSRTASAKRDAVRKREARRRKMRA